MKKLTIFCSMFCMLSLCAGSSNAALIFLDDFDGYAITYDWLGDGPWNVTGGNVDLIGEGSSWDVWSGNGRYVDLDGSSGGPGQLWMEIVGLPAGSYVLSYNLAGAGFNPGTSAPRGSLNSVDVTVGAVASANHSLNYDVSFATYTLPFTIPVAMTVNIGFLDPGTSTDNHAGLILDDVRIDSVDVVKIPVPGAVLLSTVGRFCGIAAKTWKAVKVSVISKKYKPISKPRSSEYLPTPSLITVLG